MSITAYKLCNQDHQSCSKSKSSWTHRCGVSFMDIHSLGAYLPHVAGLGVAICSYNNNTGDTETCRSDQTISGDPTQVQKTRKLVYCKRKWYATESTCKCKTTMACNVKLALKSSYWNEISNTDVLIRCAEKPSQHTQWKALQSLQFGSET